MFTSLFAEKAKLDVLCDIPGGKRAFEECRVVARIYEYDPRLADVAATEVASMGLRGLQIEKGEVSSLRFPLSVEKKSDRSYYLTIYVYPKNGGEKRLFFIDGFQKVFEKLSRQRLKLSLMEAR